VSQDPSSDQITAYLDWYFDRSPVHADGLGAPGYAHRLGDFSAAAFDSREREVTGWLARFEAEPDGIDRDLVVSVLRGQLLMAGWPAWRRDPSVYLTPAFAGLLLPFLHKLHPEPELVEPAVAPRALHGGVDVAAVQADSVCSAFDHIGDGSVAQAGGAQVPLPGHCPKGGAVGD
jgi:hypothetical protein